MTGSCLGLVEGLHKVGFESDFIEDLISSCSSSALIGYAAGCWSHDSTYLDSSVQYTASQACRRR